MRIGPAALPALAAPPPTPAAVVKRELQAALREFERRTPRVPDGQAVGLDVKRVHLGRRRGFAIRIVLAELFLLTLRIYATARRPWYRHPRWHVCHWEFQVHAWQRFNRWAWSRCKACDGRFRWGETPVSGSWNGVGPRFLKGEPDIWHERCQLESSVPAHEKTTAEWIEEF